MLTRWRWWLGLLNFDNITILCAGSIGYRKVQCCSLASTRNFYFIGRVIAPARKTDTKSSSRQLTFGKRTLTSQIDRKDSNYGFDFRTLRIEDLETLGSGTTQERSGGRGRGQPQASTSRNTGSNPAGRQAGATGRAPITQLGGSTRRPGSTRLGTAPSGLPEDTVERPSTARFSMSDPQELSKTRTSGKKALVPPALSFAFRAQGHAPVIEPSTIGGPGPGHYSCKYTCERRPEQNNQKTSRILEPTPP